MAGSGYEYTLLFMVHLLDYEHALMIPMRV